MISGNLEFNERDTGHWKRKEKRPTLPGSRKVFIKQLLLESRAEDLQSRQDWVGEINPGREKARINIMESEQLHGIF